jgi:G3E family GTPase
MRILLFGGFLGSGKTTIIRAFIDAIQAGGLGSIAIIENEIGEVGIDDVLLREGSVKITPLFGGCVCCEITGSLVVAVDEIYRQVSPDWLIIELTGVAELQNVKELLETYTNIGLEAAAIAVVDGSRWARLQVIGDFIRDQVMGSDLLIINKTDLCPDPDPIADDLAELTGVSEIMLMAAGRDRSADSIRILQKLFNLARSHDESGGGGFDEGYDHDEGHDHDGHDEEHDHEHDHDERLVGAFSVNFAIRPELAADKDRLVERLTDLFTEIGDLLSRDGIIYGHVKGVLMESEDSYARFSLTRQGRPDILTSGGWITSQGAGAGVLSLTMNFNSMIHPEKEIEALVEPCLSRYGELFAEQ